jgi:hypothetical protein|tara:strand:+ start:6373 stop:7518 length:1146 start_codon:yes stop_codon:yes gene_type:complete
MNVESKIREFLVKDKASPVLSEETLELDEKAGLPNSKDVGDKTAPSQGDSAAAPSEDMSGSDPTGGLTSVNKAAAKAKKDGTLPKGAGAGDAINYEDKVDPKTVVAQASSAGVREESESEEEVIVEDEVAEEEVIVEADEALFASDVDALFADEENLTEEFKVKAAGIFEAVVTARIANEMEAIEAELQEEVQLQQETFKSELVEKVDSFLNYVAENWMKENELAIERGLRTEITEDFISGMKTLFAEHYIEVPQDKYDVLGEMQDKIDSLETKLNESVEEKIALTTEKTSFQRQAIVTEACADLTLTESDKFAKLVEDIDFGSEAIFAEKIAVVKENYFPKQAVVSEEKLDDTVDGEYLAESSNSGMNKYAQAISKSVLK